MFCDLNGATRKPSWRKMRQSAATSVLFPQEDAVPCTISTLAANVDSFQVCGIVEADKDRVRVMDLGYG